MRYFTFDFTSDTHLIDSFLESSSLAHKQEKKTKEWFLWKFRDNPFCESIIACAEEHGVIAGCVAYGMQDFWLNGKKIKAALSFETFVHPYYQGAGIFSKLIKLGEEEAKKKGIAFLLNFPNSNSLRGFVKSGWIQIDKPEYQSLFRFDVKNLSSIMDVKKGFSPNPSNLDKLTFNNNDFEQTKVESLNSVITSEYLKWRFFSFPVSEYAVVEYDDVYAIIRVGKRGKLTEGQVLFINYSGKLNTRKFVKACRKVFDHDILSFSISRSNPVRKGLKKNLFLKVPNSTNICFKILDEKQITSDQVRGLSLSAINYHTY